jgi:hypothetical protein
MRYLKVLGLAAVAAMAMMAFLGTSGASATVLCTTTSTPCGSTWHVDTLELSLVKGSTAVLEMPEAKIVDTCTGSTMKWTKKATGSSTTTPVGEVTAANLTWTGCTQQTKTLAGGELEVHWENNGTDNGAVTAIGFQVTISMGVSCVYTAGAGLEIGELIGDTDLMHVETLLEKTGGIFCPPIGKFTATYTITNHSKIYVEPS